MSKIDIKTVYSTVELDKWANVKDLGAQEKYLIGTYLNKDGKTLEAGTAGGRILFGMKEMGFTSLHGFDFIPELIEAAKKKDITGAISFDIQDATDLRYKDSFFDQILYMGQIISSIEDKQLMAKAVMEANRILKPGGTALFTFLCLDVRSKSWVTLYLTYIKVFRKLTGSRRTIQSIPWLKLGGKPNYRAIIDHGPHAYWFKIKEAAQLLTDSGFKIIAIGTSQQIYEGKLHDSWESLYSSQIDGTLYAVCTK